MRCWPDHENLPSVDVTSDWITDARVQGWVEQISEGLPDEGGSGGQAPHSLTRPTDLNIISRRDRGSLPFCLWQTRYSLVRSSRRSPRF